MKLKHKKIQRILFCDIPVIMVSIIMIACIRWGVDGKNEDQEPKPGEIVINPDPENPTKERFSAQAGDEVVFKFTTWWNVVEDRTGNHRFILSVLLPKSWKGSENFKITYTRDPLRGEAPGNENKEYSFILETELPKNGRPLTWAEALMYESTIGGGENKGNIGGLEWVTFKTEESIDLNAYKDEKGNMNITARFIAGDANLSFKPAFYISYTDHGVKASGEQRHFKLAKDFQCFEVSGASSPSYTDYCEAHYNAIEPFVISNNDLVTISYQGDIFATGNNLDEVIEEGGGIHLIATAYTEGNKAYPVTTTGEKNLMIQMNEFSRDHTIGFWPVEYFGIPDGETIERIEYYFADKDNKIWQKEEETDDEGKVISEKPFVTYFFCD